MSASSPRAVLADRQARRRFRCRWCCLGTDLVAGSGLVRGGPTGRQSRPHAEVRGRIPTRPLLQLAALRFAENRSGEQLLDSATQGSRSAGIAWVAGNGGVQFDLPAIQPGPVVADRASEFGDGRRAADRRNNRFAAALSLRCNAPAHNWASDMVPPACGAVTGELGSDTAGSMKTACCKSNSHIANGSSPRCAKARPDPRSIAKRPTYASYRRSSSSSRS